jgi:guanylate cyclase
LHWNYAVLELPIATLIPESDTGPRRLPSFVDRLVSFGEDPNDSGDLRAFKRIVIGSLWISLVPNALTSAYMFTADAPLAGVALTSVALVVLFMLLTMRARPKAWPGIFHMLVVANFGVSIAMTYLFGGLAESGTNFIWGFVGVLAAVVVFRDRRGAIWLAVFVVLVILTPILVEDVEPRYDLPDAATTTAANLAIVGVFVFVILLYFIRQRDALHDESEALLRNVLPDEIADRLRRSGGMIADYFEEASILFADVVDFTPMSAEMTPAETVELLNEIFSFFDELVDEAGLEKIKTVGDEYMVAAGVPHPNPNHAHALADLALAIRDHTESNEVQGRRISFRIGINSGPVVAGIIGQKKFTYDLWGDSVNTASRMESHGVGGKIQISELTYGILQDDFVCEPRGEIEVKGKGRVAVWYLEGRR